MVFHPGTNTKCLLVLSFLVITLTSCNSFFYYPDKRVFYDPSHFGFEPQKIHFDSLDGTRLAGWLFPSKTGPPAGTILHFHGNAQNMSTHFMFSAWLSEQGYQVFIFDYRGYGKSEGEPTPDGIQMDAKAAYRYVVENIHQPEEKLVLLGQSLGGIVMLAMLEKAEKINQISAIVIDSSFGSYQDIAKEKLAENLIMNPLKYFVPLLVSDETAPKNSFERLKGIPILLLHGDQDPIIPLTFGKRLFDRAFQPKEMWIVEGGGHTAAFIQKGAQFRPKFLEYLSRVD